MGRSKLLQGYLLTSSGEELTRESVLCSPGLSFVRQLTPTKWDEYRFRSPLPLRGEDQLTLTGYFDYSIFCRRSGGKVLLLGEALSIVDSLLRQEAASGKSPKLRRMSIAVDSLVKALAGSPGRYLLSRVDALVPGGQNLRSISFYGDDIGEAELFKSHLNVLQCYGCGLREVSEKPEILRLVNRGIISFQFSGSKRIIEVEKALSFVSGKNFLKFGGDND